MPRGNSNVRRSRVKRSLDLKLPIKAISTNKLYAGQKRRSWVYKNYRKQVFKFLGEQYPDKVSLSNQLSVDMEVGFSSTLCDLDNSLKGILDVIAAFYDFNDRQIYRIVISKYLVNKGEEFTNIKIRNYKKQVDRRHKGNGKKIQ